MSLLTALKSYLRIRTLPYRMPDRAHLLAWQSAKLSAWLQNDVPKVAAFSARAGRKTVIDDLSIMDKSKLMADFSRFNVPAITNAQGWRAFEGEKRIGDYIVGASTGTSGNRGLFVISQAERFAWLGAMLAKALPDFWRHRDRVAVLLPIDTPLYDSANRTRNLTLQFFNLSTPLEEFSAALSAFDPTIVIAPPRILSRLAGMPGRLSPRRVFSAAEKLEAADRLIIEAGFGLRLGEIYMATEGLLGVTCAHGRLHLAEDCMHFAFEEAGNGLVRPILSDFSRSTQIMARYRLNDLLRLDDRTCPCGSPLQVVREIVGREDDVFLLSSPNGGIVELTPDILRNVIVDTDRGIMDFALVQTDAAALELQLPADCPAPVRRAVRANLTAVLESHGVSPDCHVESVDLAIHSKGKLRRIRRAWQSTGGQ
ncbi:MULTISPECIES: CoF synthetase [Rhizobium]|uniref:CoF synthetase n=1 Tax=Rhizobium rhododendri TaxID=2506430 RepID=A0ABY8IRK0_9HYPH|nr:MULTISPECIES: CoF synthetase [Rhizobium]TQX85176.1 CoF synthetase [Rhizobium sp. rho-13.1]TQY09464.1 CoF synthetase [Rhizobium sp. rho-1.1]WFS25946.1 CoF synthetase [Rhizobium rhododendri]